MFPKPVDIFPAPVYKEKMEMPDKIIKKESKELLGIILAANLECGSETPFEELLTKIGYVKPCRELSLEEADQRLQRLLSK